MRTVSYESIVAVCITSSTRVRERRTGGMAQPRARTQLTGLVISGLASMTSSPRCTTFGSGACATE